MASVNVSSSVAQLARLLGCLLVATAMGQALYLVADYRVNASNWGWQRAALPASPVRELRRLSLAEEGQRVVLQVEVTTEEGERHTLRPVNRSYGSSRALHLARLPWLISDTTCGPPVLFMGLQRPPATVEACRSANVGGTENSLTAAAVLDANGVVWLNSRYTPGYFVLLWMVGWSLLPAVGLIAGLWWVNRHWKG